MKPPVAETVPFLFESVVNANLGIWAEGTVFLAAVSGGADSIALLTALIALRKECGYKVHCLHVDHGIRSSQESRGDALAVKDFCNSLGVPCCIRTIPSGTIAETAKREGLGIEGAARLFRHQAWNREARRIGAARILVGHTQDDLLETALMRFLRGSGPAGLAAMPRERGQIVRPLLTLTRSDVLDYLQVRGIPFRTDSTNEDLRYLRNRIRHTLVPCLDDLFPYWRKTVLAMAETQGLTAEFLSAEAEKRIPWEEEPEECRLRTSEESFFSQPLVVREEALFQAVDRLAKNRKNVDPDTVSQAWTSPRRRTLRLFAAGLEPVASDAGPIRLERRNRLIGVSSSAGTADKKGQYDDGFTLLIKKPGGYTVRGLHIFCQFRVIQEEQRVLPLGIPVKLGRKKQEGLGFFANLPVVFRRSYQDSGKGLDRMGYLGYTDSITAEDAKGLVARIFLDKKDTMILLCREDEGAAPSFVIVSGGIDV